MLTKSPAEALTDMHARPGSAITFFREFVIGLIAFLTVVDLFATQAILPLLAKAYDVSPAAMGTAANASTFGMAIAGLAVAFFSRKIDRRRGVVLSLALLSLPTALLAIAPDLTTFTVLRVVQGLCMSTAFTLTVGAEKVTSDDVAPGCTPEAPYAARKRIWFNQS